MFYNYMFIIPIRINLRKHWIRTGQYKNNQVHFKNKVGTNISW